jgi:preprotein translocase subunit SecG
LVTTIPPKVVVAVTLLMMIMMMIMVLAVAIRHSELERIVSKSHHQQTTPPQYIILLYFDCRLKIRFFIHTSFAIVWWNAHLLRCFLISNPVPFLVFVLIPPLVDRNVLHLTLTGDYKHATNFRGYQISPFNGSNRVIPQSQFSEDVMKIETVKNVRRCKPVDRLRCLVVRVSGYRSRGSGFESRCYQIFWEIVGLERGAHSLVSTNEELLERKSSGFGLENWEYDRVDPLLWPRRTIYPQKLPITFPTSGGRSVGIVSLRTKTTEFSLYLCQLNEVLGKLISDDVSCVHNFPPTFQLFTVIVAVVVVITLVTLVLGDSNSSSNSSNNSSINAQILCSRHTV